MTPDPARVRELLDYDAASGLLRWKPRAPNQARFNTRFAGKQAGYLDARDGITYLRIQLDGRVYYGHRLAWMVAYGEDPTVEIDHRNGCGTDNRLVNLRLAPGGLNGLNRAIRSDNTTGVTGTHYNSSTKKYKAYVRYHGKLHNLGWYDTLGEAGEVARKARENFGFSPAHGKTKAERFSLAQPLPRGLAAGLGYG